MIGYDKISGIIKKTAIYVICGLMLFIMFFLTVQSMFYTCDMNMNNAMLENVEYNYDCVPLNILTLAVGFGLLYLIRRFTVKVKPWIFMLAVVIWTLAFGILWIFSARSAPTHDSYIVTTAAFNANAGNYSAVGSDYFKHFPFQLGYVLFSELCIKLFCPVQNYLAIEVINVVFLALAYFAIMRICSLVFKNERIVGITAVLLVGCLPPVLFCSFLYGNIPGFAFSMTALWLAIKFLQKRKWYFALLSALSIGLSVAIKLNNMIILVAIVIIVAVDTICRKKWLNAIYIAAALICALGINKAIIYSYECRAEIKFDDGIPMISWAAMGFSESNIAPGWFNSTYTTVNYDNNEMNAGKAAEASMSVIKQRIGEFKGNSVYTNNFFSKKILSQWNEPSYQSIWTNQVRGIYGEQSGIGKYVCTDGEYLTKSYMGFYQQLIFFFTLLSTWYCIKEKNLYMASLLLIILGGFLYHLIFEAKSQYAITYFIIMVPLAAYGINRLSIRVDALLEKLKLFKHKKFNKPEDVNQ